MKHRFVFLIFHLGCVFKIDCGDWIEPSNNQNKWANETGSVLFEWKYNLGSGDTPSNVAVQCGYFKDTDLHTFVQKIGHTNPLAKTNDAMSSRVDVLTRNEDPGYVAFRLRSVQKSDEYAYQCTLSTPLSKKSKTYTLKVLKRPEFRTFSVNPTSVEAGKAITINVVTSGNPVPRLICYLMSTSGNEIDRLPRSGRTSNITQKTFLVTKESKEVLCIATGDRTGSVSDTRQLNVISKCKATVINLNKNKDKVQISSPNNTSLYAGSLNCSYYIHGLHNASIQIEFKTFELLKNNSLDCSSMDERIELYGKDDKRPSYVECGSKKNFTITFPTDFVRVDYITRGGNFRRKGFEAVVYLVGSAKKTTTLSITKPSKATSTKLTFMLPMLMIFMAIVLM
ncbi:uncharacterized protein LOC130636448 isoform X3 [Hydractinia symbiolongicarpus]|uniref:uncharacterized protein LOC130636448 isoform X3 n=1 Tax=Hydractinia symbiolongicarpus TaxID=13093 RepID=UPI00254A91B1|nr:uncharacterized protein LOC130636448 isoform X3 [Hydractinia symbiolongicarpus]